ncbi:hypothetical protein GOP47_0022203 [Adiantum capillus-veneris]|uniref:Uncharacterized protein n=1 Tax=Adiantum capillus-veneris TaxID=13818 RepID=A0A9D4Z8K7_ADICA|nr:hypothetical protein GOP47_0022203 [Adiantum capillus-veneris]
MKERMEKRRCKSSSSPSSSSTASKGGRNVCASRVREVDQAKEQAGGTNKLEKMAGWVGAGLHTAFFLSLDRCQCVKLDTLEEPILLRRPLLQSPDHHNRHVEVIPSSTTTIAEAPLHTDDRSNRSDALTTNPSETRPPFAHSPLNAPLNAIHTEN